MNVFNAKADAHDESDAGVKNEESGNWHKRLRLRKNTVKQEKKITNQKRARKATETSENPEGVENDRAVDRSESKHTFCCSACKDGTTFRPGEFIVHYKNIHAGKAPVFPCDMCGFSTTVFSTLQHHRITHKDCLFNCEVCKDDIQHTFSQLIQHCESRHTLKGQFHCQTCQISVKNIEQFVFHLCPPTTDHDENMTNGACKSGPLTDAVGSAQKEDLLKHLAAAFRQRWRRRKWWRKRKPATKPDGNPSKFLKPEPQWLSLPSSAAGLLDNHGVLLDPEKTLEETQQFLERTVSYDKKWPAFLKTEQDVRKAGKDELTGLTEKNNLSVPPDCTTKFVGFKMMDGKKHLVLKVIPSSKRDISAPNKSKGVESGTFSHTPNHQTHSNTVLISTKCSLFPTEKRGQCEDERGKQRGDGRDTRVGTHIRHEFNLNVANHQNTKELRGDCTSDSRTVLKQVFPSAEERVYCCDVDRVKECPEETVYDDHLTSSHTGSSEDTCHLHVVSLMSEREQSPTQASDISDEALGESASEMENTDSCIQSGLISEFDLCEFECGVGDVLFHSSVDESTNNTDPRDALFPVGQRDGEKGTYSSASHQLPLTTLRHVLDEADRLTSHAAAAAAESREHDVSSRKRVAEAFLKDSRAPEESDIASSVLQRESVPPDVPRSLRLRPFGSSQSITIPRDNQPVVVLNHPDADIQEVTNIMKVVHKHKGAVRRVVLSGKTLSALSDCHAAGCGRAWPDGTVEERFSLKLRLKRVCGRKFTVVPTVSKSVLPQPTFTCWFCGRLFQNQEVWVGHGQRHLTEATRGWNQLFHR